MSDTASLDGFAPIPGYEGVYWINEQGQVRTIIRKGVSQVMRKNQLGKRGYYYISLSKDGKRKNHLVHRLLAEVYIPKVNGKNYVNHKDGVKTNIDLRNLEWCTASQNCKHAYRTGLKIPHRAISEHNKTTRLDKAKILQAHEWVKLGIPKGDIAQRLGVSRSAVYRALTKQTWRNL